MFKLLDIIIEAIILQGANINKIIFFTADVFINLKPGWLEIRKHKARNYITQSSPYRYDTRVPLIFCGWKIKHQEILKAVKMNDIAPTLSNLLRIAFPNNVSGTHPLKGLINYCLCEKVKYCIIQTFLNKYLSY